MNSLKLVQFYDCVVNVWCVGGLDEALNNIIHLCQEQGVPFVFALGRKALGRACAKLVPVSCVGVFNYDGSEVCCLAVKCSREHGIDHSSGGLCYVATC